MSDVAQNLALYFRSGAVICPYAKTANIDFFADSDLDISRWTHALRNRNVAVVHALSIERSYDQARQWCYDTVERLRKLIDGELLHRDERPLPFLVFGEETAYAIGMGPQYPWNHPRRAPHLCLVSVNEDEVRQVPVPSRAPIRRAMIARTGDVYDADYIWLPMRPTRPTQEEMGT